MQRLTRAGLSLAYRDEGTGDAAPVLLVHGWGCDHSYLAPQIERFARSRRVLAIDLRGHGSSEAPAGDYTVGSFADDLAWFCAELALVKPVVVGHSMGGTIGLELAARHPDLALAVVMIDSMVFPSPELTSLLVKMADDLRGGDYFAALDMACSVLLLAVDDPAVALKLAASLRATPRHVVVAAFHEHLVAYDATAAATACRVPIAYIGAESPLGDTAMFRNLCPQLKVGQTLGAGHFSPLLVPDQVNAMIAGFLRAYASSAEG